MKREFASLGREHFDLLVIGGGIYGAWTAYDAALRGLKVALVEKEDWASGTSSNSSKLLHGGLRYLERLQLGLVRKSLKERRLLASLGPHRVAPLRFVLPVYRGDRVGRFRLGLGLGLYDLLAGGGQPVDRHRFTGPLQLVGSHPYLVSEDATGAFTFGDCVTDDARLVLEVVAGGLQAGVAGVNRAEVVELQHAGSRVVGAVVRDCLGDSEVTVRARVTMNAAGPWVEALLPEPPRAAGEVRLTRGVHLVMPALPGSDGFLLTAPQDGRVIFLIPWYGRTLLGTTDIDYEGDPGLVRPVAEDEEYLLEAANKYLREGWTSAQVLGRFAGLRALRSEPGKSPSQVSREWWLESPLPGLLASVGGKLTSARADSAAAVDAVMKSLGRRDRQRPTGERALPWAPDEDFGFWTQEALRNGEQHGLDAETALQASRRHGTNLGRLWAVLRQDAALAGRIHPDLAFCRAEVVHALRHEMAHTLEDVLRRRIPLLLLAPLAELPLDEIAGLAGREAGWSDARRAAELQGVHEKYGQPG